MTDCITHTPPRVSLVSRLFSLLLPEDPGPEGDRHFDRKTREAIRSLSPHMRRDIGLPD